MISSRVGRLAVMMCCLLRSDCCIGADAGRVQGSRPLQKLHHEGPQCMDPCQNIKRLVFVQIHIVN